MSKEIVAKHTNLDGDDIVFYSDGTYYMIDGWGRWSIEDGLTWSPESSGDIWFHWIEENSEEDIVAQITEYYLLKGDDES